ncbi:MAG: hypothetical protein ABI960_07160 [Candidatus Eisenbacteria bacterium]
MNKPNARSLAVPKPDLSRRLSQVRRMVERVEAERTRLETAGLGRLAQEKAQEKRYWQFVQAVLELRPTMGQNVHRHTMH